MEIFSWHDIERIHSGAASVPALFQGGTALSVGSFDGPHRGHESLFTAVRTAAAERGLAPGIVTFSRSAAGAKQGNAYGGEISTPAQKLAVCSGLGMTFAVVIDFSGDFIRMEGHCFLSILADACRMKFIAEGQDFRCGYQGAVGMKEIEDFSRKNGIGCFFCGDVRFKDERISSSLIRQCIRSCRFSDAAAMLGRPYRIDCSALSWDCADGEIRADRRHLIQVLPPDGRYDCVAITHGDSLRTHIFTDGHYLRLALPFECAPDIRAIEFISG